MENLFSLGLIPLPEHYHKCGKNISVKENNRIHISPNVAVQHAVKYIIEELIHILIFVIKLLYQSLNM